jgi:hypothetical protein
MRLVRLAFSFNLIKTSRYWSGLWGGIAITAILYFLLIKGAKGSTLVSPELLEYIIANTASILVISFLGWTILFQLLASFTKVNILRITVLVGTFALAMAFAGNDMVNFIGVPLAGYESFKAFVASGGVDAGGFMMESLKEPVNTPLYFLIIAGLVMVITLRFSKKAKSVTETEINLGRQGEGSERFSSSSLARFIVRRSVEFNNGMTKLVPKRVNAYMGTRFDESLNPAPDKTQAFDLARASVNLVVASILIAIGTSLKLPLSTTYVTFMVAMGTSLADGAWGRESAVYRVTGVLTVIGGWFFTAFIAFCISFIIATLIFFGKIPVMLVLILVAIFILVRTHAFHRKRLLKKEVEGNELITTSYGILKTCDDQVKSTLAKASRIHHKTYTGLFKEKFKELRLLKKEAKHLNKDMKEIRENIPSMLIRFHESEIGTGHHYVQVVENLKEMTNSLNHIILPAYNHLDNNHPLDKEQLDEMKEFNDKISEFFKYVIDQLENRESYNSEELNKQRDEILQRVDEIQLNRIKILKKTQKGVKMSITYLDMLNETKNLVLNVVKLTKANIKLLDTSIAENQDMEQELFD